MYPYQNPNYYYYQPQMYPYFQRMPKKFNLQHTLHTTIRGIQIANQVIPIIYQVKPLIDNTKQGLTLLKAMNHLRKFMILLTVLNVKYTIILIF